MSKSKLTLSIEKDLVKTIKHIAIENDTTVSELLEQYIKAMKKNKDIIRAIEDITKKTTKV